MLCLALFAGACSEESDKNIVKKIEVQSEFKAKIKSVAGDHFDDDSFLPMPIFFNLGTLNTNDERQVETIILSDKLIKGKSINIKPVSLFKFKKDSVSMDYIISVPVDSTDNFLNIYSFHDLSNKQYQTKFLIEDWFRGNCKIGHCSNFEWQSEIQALKYFD